MFGKALLFTLLTTGAAAAAPTDSLRLELNLPSYEFEVWDGSERIRSYPVTIGMADFETPTGSFAITRVEWNPSWTPPPSRWARGKSKIAPGNGNPMGRAKLQFDDMLYVHGTYRPGELGGAYSHGCVRIANEDVLDLARLIAVRSGVLSDEEIAALEKSPRRTKSVRLPTPIPIRIRYSLSDEVDGEVVELEDPYGWAAPSR